MFADRNQFDRDKPGGPQSGESLFTAACAYLQRGWSLIPLLGKQPGVATWKEYQTRLPSADELGAWFAEADPRPTGIGVITGKLSGVVVVDCDTPDDAAHWLHRFPRSPLTVETGRGGVHVYYQAPCAAVHNRAKLFHRQIDFRGDGGYVAAPPSRHPSGRHYAWAQPGVDLDHALPLFEASWLDDSNQLPTLHAALVEGPAVRNVAAYIRRIHAISGQGGHSATFRVACKLRDAGLSPEDALTLLIEWNETNADPSWSAAELHHKINSAYQVGDEARTR